MARVSLLDGPSMSVRGSSLRMSTKRMMAAARKEWRRSGRWIFRSVVSLFLPSDVEASSRLWFIFLNPASMGLNPTVRKRMAYAMMSPVTVVWKSHCAVESADWWRVPLTERRTTPRMAPGMA